LIIKFLIDYLFEFRLCKEPNHIPLRCDEVEKGIELEMRKFIEEHVTEAMIRKCPRCTQVCQ
jgi:TRIAD3 protein (E3 ubiquitin-protein ligase RNF216)